MKTIFIVVYSGRDVRDILRTDVLKILKASGLRIVVLSAAYNEQDFIDEFSDENVIIEQLYLTRCRNELLFLKLMNELLTNANFSNTNKIKLQRERWLRQNGMLSKEEISKNRILFLIKNLSSKFLFYNKNWFKQILKKKFILLFPDKQYNELFNKYKPSLVFLSHSFTGPDVSVVKAAIKHRVPTIALIPSWDNLTSKGSIPVKIDRLIVWNEIMKREAVELHEYSTDDVYLSGIPPYDLLTVKDLPPKKDFFAEHNLDVNKKLITYCMGNDSYFPNEYQIIEIMDKAISKKEIKFPTQILVRRYTKNIDEDKIQNLSKLPNVLIQRQDHQSTLLPGNWSQKKKDLLNLGMTMKYSDIVMNFASTITIDASIFDTPIINIGFDGYDNKEYLDSVDRYHDYSHYNNIIKTGGVKLAKDQKQLIKFINQYFLDPTLDAEGRARIVKEQCYKLDGRSSQRIADAVLDYLKEVSK